MKYIKKINATDINNKTQTYQIPLLLNGVLIKNISLKNKITLFNTLRKDDNFYLNVLEKSKLFDIVGNPSSFFIIISSFSHSFPFNSTDKDSRE